MIVSFAEIIRSSYNRINHIIFIGFVQIYDAVVQAGKLTVT